MKQFILPTLAIICTAAILSFSNKPENKSAFVCQWFIYDDPFIITPSLDFPSSLSDATNPWNYRIASEFEVFSACYGSVKLCAICAETDVNGDPMVYGGIINLELQNYFATPEIFRNPSPFYIKEKFSW